jgi:hypothetical protein
MIGGEVEFLIEPFPVPSVPEVHFNLYVPIEEITFNKEPLFNYGLDLELFLEKNSEKFPSALSTNLLPLSIKKGVYTKFFPVSLDIK